MQLFVVVPPRAAHQVAEGCITQFGWAPDGSHLGWTLFEQPTRVSIVVANPDGSAPETFTDAADPTWSPAGTRIAFQREHSIVVAEVASGVEHVVDTGGVSVSGPVWGPRNGLILFEGPDGQPYVVPSAGGAVRAVATCGLVRWSPDARSISDIRYHCVPDGTEPPPPTDVFDVASGKRLFRTNGAITWSPTGRQLMISMLDTVTIADRTGKHRVLLGHFRSGSPPIWNTTGTRVAVPGQSRFIRVFNNKGRHLRTFTGYPSLTNDVPGWSASGNDLAFVCSRRGRRSLCVSGMTGPVRTLALGARPTR